MKLLFYSDAGHGWLRVPRFLLAELGLLDVISSYSYQSKTGKTVYLEEDGDCRAFMDAVKKANKPVSIVDVDHGDRSFVRSLPRFNKGI
jgi:hypothetical protein